MTLSPRSLREELRAVSDALSAAELAIDSGPNNYAQLGVTDAQLRRVRRGLLQTARKHLALVAENALAKLPGAALPGLPRGGPDGDGAVAGQAALAAAWSSLAEFEALRSAKDGSISAYRKALQFQPDDGVANAQLADLLERQHDLDNANTHAERALRFDPGNFIASMALARTQLRLEKFSEAERTATAATKAPRIGADDLALAWSLVGEACDRRGASAEAFKAFAQSNRLMRQRYGEMQHASHPAHPANVRRLTAFVEGAGGASVRPTAGFETPAPAFLIGFPRSGTTLVEQILSSHPDVTCLGETECLFEALSLVLREGDLLVRVAALTSPEIESVRAAYKRVVQANYPETGEFVVDKHPLHIVLLPVINKIFPDAKIIFTQRDPRDVVLSCYQQCFGVNVATAQFWEIATTADYYDAVMSMMGACRTHLKLDLLQVEYRDVVADLEREARRLAGFLGLPFAPAMLRYDETARTRSIGSASARQVINPIYERSVGRWRRYARELAPVLPLLGKWARRLGYDE